MFISDISGMLGVGQSSMSAVGQGYFRYIRCWLGRELVLTLDVFLFLKTSSTVHVL